VRTALFNWFFARQSGGRFLLRIEDTDRERSSQEAVQAIIDGLEWLGIDFDEGPIFQTDRMDRYSEMVQMLLDKKKAYRCYCSKERLSKLRELQLSKREKPRYDGLCRNLRENKQASENYVVRLRTPGEGQVVVEDLVQGTVSYQNTELDDLIIARGDGSPTYHLAAVVDDIDMGVTHVIRGDDHLNNTPRQLHLYQALGKKKPEHAHIPMIHGNDGKKLSKRHGALSVLEYRELGFLPEAVINYLSRLGWSRGDQEIFSVDDLTALFGLEDVNKAAARFDVDKLTWINHQHMLQLDSSRLVSAVRPYLPMAIPKTDERVARIFQIQRERAKTLVELAFGSSYFFQKPQEYEPKAAKKHLREETVSVLSRTKMELESMTEWSISSLDATINKISEDCGLGMSKIAQPLRVALTGTAASPGIGETLFLIGRDEVLDRISFAVRFIENGQKASE